MPKAKKKSDEESDLGNDAPEKDAGGKKTPEKGKGKTPEKGKGKNAEDDL